MNKKDGTKDLTKLLTFTFIIVINMSLLTSCSSHEGTGIPPTIFAAKTNHNNNRTALNNLMQLHTKYCARSYNSKEALETVLKNSSELSLDKGFNGVYTVGFNNIVFAVSPEDDGCTTDLMLVTAKYNKLFTFEEINKALLNLGYKETGSPVSRKDIGTDQSELTIIEKKYISPKGEITTLDYPLEKHNRYYMTLFSEKFT